MTIITYFYIYLHQLIVLIITHTIDQLLNTLILVIILFDSHLTKKTAQNNPRNNE